MSNLDDLLAQVGALIDKTVAESIQEQQGTNFDGGSADFSGGTNSDGGNNEGGSDFDEFESDYEDDDYDYEDDDSDIEEDLSEDNYDFEDDDSDYEDGDSSNEFEGSPTFESSSPKSDDDSSKVFDDNPKPETNFGEGSSTFEGSNPTFEGSNPTFEGSNSTFEGSNPKPDVDFNDGSSKSDDGFNPKDHPNVVNFPTGNTDTQSEQDPFAQTGGTVLEPDSDSDSEQDPFAQTGGTVLNPDSDSGVDETPKESNKQSSSYEYKSGYGSDADARRSEVEDMICRDVETGIADLLKNYKETEKFRREQEASKKTERQANMRVMRDSAVVNGETIQFKSVMEEPNWKFNLKPNTGMDSSIENLWEVKNVISEGLLTQFGGVDNIHQIVVFAEQLVINGVCYRPKLSRDVINALPLDCKDYILNGSIAPLFDWGYLLYMKSVTSLSFDSSNFVYDFVAQDLNIPRGFNPLSLFKKMPSLRMLDIAGDVVTYPIDKSNKETNEAMKSIRENAEVSSRWDKGYEAFQNSWIWGTSGVSNFFLNSLTSYATNRGNKGFLRYSLGVITRSGAVGATQILDKGSKLLGWGIHGIGNVVKKAWNNSQESDEF